LTGVKRRVTDLRAWGRAESVARAAIASATDHARGATHFHADYVSPAWARALCPTARIGRHIFYRECTPTAGLRTEIGL
jgi:spore germination cell wall hydrolase CwlJ-like protein